MGKKVDRNEPQRESLKNFFDMERSNILKVSNKSFHKSFFKKRANKKFWQKHTQHIQKHKKAKQKGERQKSNSSSLLSSTNQ